MAVTPESIQTQSACHFRASSAPVSCAPNTRPTSAVPSSSGHASPLVPHECKWSSSSKCGTTVLAAAPGLVFPRRHIPHPLLTPVTQIGHHIALRRIIDIVSGRPRSTHPQPRRLLLRYIRPLFIHTRTLPCSIVHCRVRLFLRHLPSNYHRRYRPPISTFHSGSGASREDGGFRLGLMMIARMA
jgi:hypothetical protein